MNKKNINPFLIKFIKFFLYFYILIIIHEIGHLIMALIFNFTVLEFSVGLLSFFSFKLFNINFLFGLIPLTGYTSYLSNLIWWQDFIVASGGILISFSVGSLLFLIVFLIIKFNKKNCKLKKYFILIHKEAFYSFIASFLLIFNNYNNKYVLFSYSKHDQDFIFDKEKLNKIVKWLIYLGNKIYFLNIFNLLPIPGFDGYYMLRLVFKNL